MSLDQEYEHLISPEIFIKNFKGKDEFRVWLRKGCINDLKATLKAFENSGMFEYCDIIQAEIDVKVDTILEGLGFV